jgi:phage gp46-like protein
MPARILSGDEPLAFPVWDTVWQTDINSPVLGTGDWVLATEGEEGLPGDPLSTLGGFRANRPIETAILLQLFSNKRRPDWMKADDGATVDPGGWHGDSFDVDQDEGEREIGSLLWTLERADLNAQTGRMAEHFATEALQTLIDQKAISEAIVASEIDAAKGRLILRIRIIGVDGEVILAQAFPIR